MVHVPTGVADLVVNVPLPGDVLAYGWSQSVDSVVVSSVPAASRMATVSDCAGNKYREVVFDTPAVGDISILFKVNSAVVIADLDSAMPLTAYPIGYVPDDVSPYLRSSSIVQSDDPNLQHVAKQLVSKCHDEASAAQAIADWVFENVTFSPKAPSVLDAAGTYKSHKAQCRGFGYLFCALARAAGIPARLVSGYTTESSMEVPTAPNSNRHVTIRLTDTPHAWVQVWYPGAGWIPYDPQMTAGFVDTHHLLGAVGLPGDEEKPLVSWHVRALSGRDLTYDQTPKVGNIVDFVGFEYASGDVTSGHILLNRASGPTSVVSSAFAR